VQLLLLVAQCGDCLSVSSPGKLQFALEVILPLLTPALFRAELLQLGASLPKLVRKRFRLETMPAFVFLETTNLVVTVHKCTLMLCKRVLGLIVSAPSKRQLSFELTQAVLSLTLFSPQLFQLISHVPKLALPRFRFEL
jgi:hypothetical protein